MHAYRPEPRPPPPVERLWAPPPDAWRDPALARRCAFAYAVGGEVSKLVHVARQAKRLRGAGDAMVEVRVAAGSEMHAALRELGPELNDMLGVCATRLVESSGGDGAAAAGGDDGGGGGGGGAEAADGAEALGTFEGAVGVEQQQHALRVVLRATSAPKCERCWRYIPEAVTAARVESMRLEDGWLYRGHPGPACTERAWEEPAK